MALSIVYIYLWCTYDTYAAHESWADIKIPIIEGYSTSFADRANHSRWIWRQIYFWGTYVFRKNTSTRKHIKKEGKVGAKIINVSISHFVWNFDSIHLLSFYEFGPWFNYIDPNKKSMNAKSYTKMHWWAI